MQKYLDVVKGVRREQNDCGIVVVSLLAGVSYQEAARTLEVLGRGRNQKTELWKIYTALSAGGMYMDILRYEKQTYKKGGFLKSKTVLGLTKSRIPSKNYLVTTSRHALAIINGEIEDWSTDRKFHIKTISECLPYEGR